MTRSRRNLLAAAKKAASRAHAPYSRFPVGAALEADDGRIFTGCNVENASYGLTVCAERVAVFNAVQAGCRAFRRIAIVAGAGPNPAPPCGACRQVLAEFAGPSFEIVIASIDGLEKAETYTLADLLPHPFSLKP